MDDYTLRRRALSLSYFTVCYNVLEGAVSIFLGILARSPALLGFALDSFVESVSGGVMLWRFGKTAEDDEQAEARERRAVKLVGWTFLLLGAYVLYESLEKLITRELPAPSPGGMVLAVVSLIAMPWLAREKIKVARALGSASLLGDAKETLACAWLSVALLLGLGLNYGFHWWWADPVAGLVIVFFLWREGREMVSGEGCCCGGDGC
jgi:divalent metal cation (Fe/Co/Zn/Cd) transporter